MKITNVEIRGFQSHADSDFPLSPGLTVITGPSDVGKTAIIRALRWLAFNEPTGEAFLHTIRGADGEVVSATDSATVSVTLDNGVMISKTRRKGKTTYTHSDYPEPWEKAELPPEIKDTLGLIKQEYGDFTTCLNFAFQLDAPFLLSETGSVGAKVLGKLAGTEVVDRANGSVNKSIHRTRNDIAQAEKRVGQIDVELLEYLELDGQAEQLNKAQNLFNAVDKARTGYDTLIELNNIYADIAEKRGDLVDRLRKTERVPVLMDTIKQVDYDNGKLTAINQLYRGFVAAYHERRAASQTLKALEHVPYAAKRLDSLQALAGTYARLSALRDAYNDVRERVQRYTATLELYAAVDTAKTRLQLVITAASQHVKLNALYNAFKTAVDERNAYGVKVSRLWRFRRCNG